MSTAPDSELHRIALSIERLEGKVETGFAVVRGDINLLARGEGHLRNDVEGLEKDVEELKSRRFPLPVIGGLCGVGALVLSGFQMTGKA